MEADGVTIAERNDEQAYVAFKCLDPDGHRIEVCWEPLRSGNAESAAGPSNGESR